MNPALLILLIPFLSSILKGVKSGIDNTAEGKYNNLFLVILGAAAIYILVKGFNKSKQQTYLNTAGTDPATQQAQALRDAMNRSGIPLMMNVDGTDVDLIMQTAKLISDYSAVSDSYRVLYNSELTLDLQGELSRTDLQRFYDYVYKRSSGTTTTTTSNAGKTVTAIATVNVRKYEDYNVVDHQAKVSEKLGTYVGETSLFVNGQTGVFVIVESTSWVVFTNKYYVLKNAVKIG